MPTEHTPGPWHVGVSYRGKDRQHTDYVIRAETDNLPDGSRVALVSDGRHVLDPKPNPETEANANLISAAPDLLEALRTVLYHLPSDQDALMRLGLDSWIYEAREAVKKAGGR